MADFIPPADDAKIILLTNLRVNLYSRLKGQSAWKFVSRNTNSPYDDYTALAVPGTPEVREYQAYGVLGDQQIGQPSDIVSVTFGG